MKKFLATLLTAVVVSLAPASAQTLIGSGSNSSFLVIEASAFGAPLIFEVLYDFNPGNPFDSYALMTVVDAAVSDLSFSFVNYGTVQDPNYFLDSVTWQSLTLTNTAWPAVGPFWGQWVSGGLAGYPTAAPVAEGAWEFGSGISDPYRIVEPGSWDGFIFNDGSAAPSVAPVPEPATAGLLVMVAAGILAGRRRRTANT